MPSSQDLVPTGGEYGARQETVGLMQQAGVPLASSPGSGPQPQAPISTQPGVGAPDAGGPMTGIDLLMSTAPGDFGFLGQEDPAQPATEPDSPVRSLAASSQSSFGAAVLARLAQRR